MSISNKCLSIVAIATVLNGGFASDVCASQTPTPESEMTQEQKNTLIQKVTTSEMRSHVSDLLNNDVWSCCLQAVSPMRTFADLASLRQELANAKATSDDKTKVVIDTFLASPESNQEKFFDMTLAMRQEFDDAFCEKACDVNSPENNAFIMRLCVGLESGDFGELPLGYRLTDAELSKLPDSERQTQEWKNGDFCEVQELKSHAGELIFNVPWNGNYALSCLTAGCLAASNLVFSVLPQTCKNDNIAAVCHILSYDVENSSFMIDRFVTPEGPFPDDMNPILEDRLCVLVGNSKIRRLGLRYTKMENFASFAEAVGKSERLEVLSLNFTDTDDSKLEKLSEGIACSRSLCTLHLQYNRGITCRGANALFKALRYPENGGSVAHVDLGSCDFSEGGLAELCSLLKQENCPITHLSLRGCNLMTYDGVLALAEAIMCNHTLVEVDLSYNFENRPDLRELLEEALKLNPTITHYEI